MIVQAHVGNVEDLESRSILDMQETAGWRLYAAKIEHMIQQHERRCQDASLSEPEIRKAQYTLAALRDVKALPETMRKEAQQRSR